MNQAAVNVQGISETRALRRETRTSRRYATEAQSATSKRAKSRADYNTHRLCMRYATYRHASAIGNRTTMMYHASLDLNKRSSRSTSLAYVRLSTAPSLSREVTVPVMAILFVGYLEPRSEA